MATSGEASDLASRVTELEQEIRLLRAVSAGSPPALSKDCDEQNKAFLGSVLNLVCGKCREELSRQFSHLVASDDSPVPSSPHLVEDTTGTSGQDEGSLVDSLKSAAQRAVESSGFKYDPTTGLYFDSLSGLYYDSSSQLYYDGKTGTYYTFSAETGQYAVHSIVDLKKLKKKMARSQPKPHPDLPLIAMKRQKEEKSVDEEILKSESDDSETEEGEICSTDSETESSSTSREETPPPVPEPPIPCIRMMVTQSDSVEKGKLFIVTCDGATAGRQAGLGLSIVLPDATVSKVHSEFRYDRASGRYTVRDMASQSGTLLNGARINPPLKMGEPAALKHLDRLQIGSTHFSLHIHPGVDVTCVNCEPGLLPSASTHAQNPADQTASESSQSLEQARRKQLKQIRKKFGLEAEPYVQTTVGLTAAGTEDKAAIRRRTVGSDNPYAARDEAPASVHQPIADKNKGRKLLERMGWKKGEGLGKTERSGIKEPVQVHMRAGEQRAGLGSNRVQAKSLDEGGVKVDLRWSKTRERFAQIEKLEKAGIFQADDDDEGMET